mmetsp:Transcript_89362/g.251636  ORF Transcript_89362/g.251636 Transcript_89362/m.251636 type:complete len:129 (-) Transcript_89362:27-413(-)
MAGTAVRGRAALQGGPRSLSAYVCRRAAPGGGVAAATCERPSFRDRQEASFRLCCRCGVARGLCRKRALVSQCRRCTIRRKDGDILRRASLQRLVQCEDSQKMSATAIDQFTFMSAVLFLMLRSSVFL